MKIDDWNEHIADCYHCRQGLRDFCDYGNDLFLEAFRELCFLAKRVPGTNILHGYTPPPQEPLF
jgi:hypothetical protein